ncbi:MAG: HD domain-containing protein [Acidimicrobiales bacterium]
MTDLIVQPGQRAAFHSMEEGTYEDWQIIRGVEPEVPLAEGVLEQLRRIGEVPGGFAVDRTTHSLQTATRAERAGRSDLYVLAALLHDIGDNLAPANHSELAAAVLQPHLPDNLHWMVLHHGEFQLYYFGHFVGADRDGRDRYAGHPWFDLTAEFCEEFDQRSFDPDFPTQPIEHYIPLVRQLIR